MSKIIWARSTKGTRAVLRLDALLVVKQIQPAIHIRTLYEQATGHHWEAARQKNVSVPQDVQRLTLLPRFTTTLRRKMSVRWQKKNDDLVT
jgi:hypothetical protein